MDKTISLIGVIVGTTQPSKSRVGLGWVITQPNPDLKLLPMGRFYLEHFLQNPIICRKIKEICGTKMNHSPKMLLRLELHELVSFSVSLKNK